MIDSVPPGTLLHGRYRVDSVLGSGGFGHVYLAVNSVTNLQCAVKEYLVTGSTGQQQLEHEASVLSKLRHPNLPAFQDRFSERGRFYVVLSYIDGSDLTDRIRAIRQKNEVIPVLQILQWLLAICDAVTFLHNQQPTIIHRDIKPDNIRITPQGTAVLVDLGNAKAAKEGDRTLFFIRHQGTPGYAPPEQYPGGSGTDARSDVYALGATLFFALTTQEPPSVQTRNQSIQQGLPTLSSLQDQLRKNPPEESPEVLAARRQQFIPGVNKPSKPAPRHSRHIAQLGKMPPDLLTRLNAIVQKSMELNPKRRYQLVADLVHDLRQVAMALGSTPPPPPVRPVDPHSTQPDLSGLYDTLQEAKRERKNDSGSAVPSSSPVRQSGPALVTCPHCGASVPGATFCPRCGQSLAKQSYPSSSNQQAQMQDRPLDKTQLAFPTDRKEAMAVQTVASVQMGGTAPAHPAPHAQDAQFQQWHSVPANGAGARAMGPRGQNYSPPSSFASLLFKYRILILCVVLLTIVLVALAIYGHF